KITSKNSPSLILHFTHISIALYNKVKRGNKEMSEQTELMIIDDLIQAIRQGKYKATGRFPSENELADYYGIPRIKVRHALLKLEEMGYLYSKQGKGRYLKPKQRQIELHLSGSSSFSEKMKQAGHELETQNLGCERATYDPKIYATLNIGPQ